MPPQYAFHHERAHAVITWTCTECGHVNTPEVSLLGSSAAQGFARSRAELNAEAQAMALENLAAKHSLLRARQTSFRAYRALGLDCRCEQCGHREPWSCKPQKPEGPEDLLKAFPASIAVLGVLFLMFVPPLPLLLRLSILLGLAGAVTGVVLHIRAKRRALDALLAPLPDSAFPILTENEETRDTRIGLSE